MSRKADVYFRNIKAGLLEESEEGYIFTYEDDYLSNPNTLPVSLTLQKRKEPYISRTMIPFFDGLIPEGWLLDIAVETWKLNLRDRMGLLLACCRDTIGAVSLVEVEEHQDEKK